MGRRKANVSLAFVFRTAHAIISGAMAGVVFLFRQLKLAVLLGENVFLEIEGTH